MRLCKDCLMVQFDDPSMAHMVRRLNFSDGFHWCENCVEGVWRKPALYFVMTLGRVEAETAEESQT